MMTSKMDIADINHSPRTLNGLFESIVNTIHQRQDNFGFLVKVSGVLGAIPDTQYARYYDVPLLEDGITIYMEIPKEILDKSEIKVGDFVQAYGTIITNLYKGQLKFRVNVMELRLTETTEAIVKRRREQATLEFLKSLGMVRRPFPINAEFRITLIYSRASSAKVDADFIDALGTSKDLVQLERRPVTISDSVDLTTAIEEATGNIVVIARGGGDEHDFAVFDSSSVLAMLARKDAFRICGIGHSSNKTLLDIVVDYSANTPTAAGTYIRDKIEEQMTSRRKVQEDLRRKDREIDELHSKAMKHGVQAEHWRQMEQNRIEELNRARKMTKIVSVACFVAGAILAWWIRH